MSNPIIDALFSLQDEKYKAFDQKLVPNIDPQTMIGIRVPVLRRYAKSIQGTPPADNFIKNLPHTYFEENNLHAILLCAEKDFDAFVSKLQEFLPFVDNWATCDMIRSPLFAQNPQKTDKLCANWLGSDHTYTVRFGIEVLMCTFLDDLFDPLYLKWVSSVKSSDYYVNMMISWYFATALAKQYNEAVTVLEKHQLDMWTHNKTIQKAVESFRIAEDKKQYLRSLRRRK